MTKLVVAFVLSNTLGVLGDTCSDIDRLLNLRAGSYVKKQYCHALFWKDQRGDGPICFHTKATKAECPSTHPLLVTEAETEVRARRSNGGQQAASVTTQPAPVTAAESKRKSGKSETPDTRSKVPSRKAHKVAEATTTSEPGPVISRNSKWVKRNDAVEMSPTRTSRRDTIDLLVMGDVGKANHLLTKTVASARRKLGSIVDSAILLGDVPDQERHTWASIALYQ